MYGAFATYVKAFFTLCKFFVKKLLRKWFISPNPYTIHLHIGGISFWYKLMLDYVCQMKNGGKPMQKVQGKPIKYRHEVKFFMNESDYRLLKNQY